MIYTVNVIANAINQLFVQVLYILPKILVAIAIWYIGKYLIGLAVRLITKIDIKGTTIDDHLTRIISTVVLILGKIFLVLIILDYLGIGQSVIGAIANGITLAVAITLGLAFGKAFEEDAKHIVSTFKKHLKAK